MHGAASEVPRENFVKNVGVVAPHAHIDPDVNRQWESECLL